MMKIFWDLTRQENAKFNYKGMKGRESYFMTIILNYEFKENMNWKGLFHQNIVTYYIIYIFINQCYFILKVL